MTKPYAPAAGQRTLNRGNQLKMLRTCRLGNPRKRNDWKCIAKAMLRAIDDHLDTNGRWTMYLLDLFDEIEVGKTAGYKWFSWLLENGLIGCDPQPDGRNELWICWATLSEFVPGYQDDEIAIPPRGTPFRHAERGSAERTDHSATRNAVPLSGIHNKEERPFSAPLSAPPPPPPSEDESPEKAAVVAKLFDFGMTCARQAIDAGLANRPLEDLVEIVDHFETEMRLPDGRMAFRDPDPMRFLFWRLTSPQAMAIPPTAGWPAADPEFRRARYELGQQQRVQRERDAFRAAREARS